MKPDNFKNVFTTIELEDIHDNLAAYIHNFEYLKIERGDCDDGFYVYTDEGRWKNGEYTQYCYSFDYLNGWLYGAVQAVNKIMKPLKQKGE